MFCLFFAPHGAAFFYERSVVSSNETITKLFRSEISVFLMRQERRVKMLLP